MKNNELGKAVEISLDLLRILPTFLLTYSSPFTIIQ